MNGPHATGEDPNKRWPSYYNVQTCQVPCSRCHSCISADDQEAMGRGSLSFECHPGTHLGQRIHRQYGSIHNFPDKVCKLCPRDGAHRSHGARIRDLSLAKHGFISVSTPVGRFVLFFPVVWTLAACMINRPACAHEKAQHAQHGMAAHAVAVAASFC